MDERVAGERPRDQAAKATSRSAGMAMTSRMSSATIRRAFKLGTQLNYPPVSNDRTPAHPPTLVSVRDRDDHGVDRAVYRATGLDQVVAAEAR